MTRLILSQESSLGLVLRDGRGNSLKSECPGVPDVVWEGSQLDWVKGGVRLYFRGVGLRYLINDAFEEGWRKLVNEYVPPKERYDLCLILPCAYGKPYSQSFIHYAIRSAIREYILAGRIHEVIVTNAGVVPRDIDEYWPYCAYDWNPRYETKEIKECYTKVLARRLEAYLRRHGWRYSKIAAYLRWDSDSWKAVKVVAGNLGLSIPNLAPKSVPDEELREVSLNGLYEDPDLVLITRSALKTLRDGIKAILT